MKQDARWVWTVTAALSLFAVAAAGQDSSARVVPASAEHQTTAIADRMLRQTLSLRLERITLEQALAAIAAKTGLRFAYSRDEAPVRKIVTLVADPVTVRAALGVLLEGTGLRAVVPGPGVVRLEPASQAGPQPTAHRQQAAGSITGRVTDVVTGVPLDQVAVRIEGPGLGAVSASDGRYTVRNVLPDTYRITARRVGYTPLTKVVAVGADSAVTVDFGLAATATKLDEVVTTAVGEQRRYEVGNVISTINADSIAPTAPITSLTDLISARAPGVTVEETSGLTGSGETIRIRGQSSLVLQGDPIVIVDGVRQDNAPGGTATLPIFNSTYAAIPSPNRLNDLDFADIQSIDVLKGPAASTEYGTDAANGVIVITTKHGTAGRPQWQASAEGAVSGIPEAFPARYYSWGHTTDLSHTTVQCPLVPYAFGSGYGSATATCAVDSVTTWNPLNHPHYSIFGTGNRQKYGLSVSGGSEAVRYFVAGGLSNETGVVRMPGVFVPEANTVGLPHSAFDPSGDDQRSVRANTAMRLSATGDLTVTGAYVSTYQTTPYALSLLSAILFSPPLRDSTHEYGYGQPFTTPIAQFGEPSNQATSRLTGGMTANWRPVPWFVGHGTIGVDHGSQRATNAVLPQLVPVFTAGLPSLLGIANTTTDIYTADLRGSVTAALAPTVRSTTSLGVQLADARLQGTTAVVSGLTTTNFTLNGAVNPIVTQLGNRQATLGGYAEEQIGLADRLFITGALRVDAGSGFGQAYSTAAYPKASVSWLALSNGSATVRLRGAFGESGVQPPNGAALELYAPTLVGLNGSVVSGTGIANVQDQRVQPERSAEYEGGVDLGFWQNRVSVELTGYVKTTHNALVSTGTGWDAGALPYEENVGEVRNTGLEGAVTATVLQHGALTWDVSLNASLNHNKLIVLAPGILSQQLAGAAATYRFAPGYPLYGYWAPRAQYVDANHDGVIEPAEVTVADSLSYAGPSLPTREASVGTHIGLWSGAVSVGALLDYRGGFRLLNTSAVIAATSRQSDQASNDRGAPLWQQARDVAVETIVATGLAGGAVPAGFYEDATYVRFRELSLTYAISRHLTRALHVQTLSLTGAVRNLALWTRYTGTDPEVANSVGTNSQLSPTSNMYLVNNNMREDFGAVPLPRYWVVRLNVGL